MEIRSMGNQNPYLFQTGEVQGPQAREAAGGAAEARSATQSDSVNLSPDAQLVRKAAEAAAQAPDVRSDRVQALRDQIAKGEYTVDAGKLADKLLEAHGDAF